MFVSGLDARSRWVAITGLLRQRDELVVNLEELDNAGAETSVAGRGGAGEFAQLARWTGARTPLHVVPSTRGEVHLMDAAGVDVHLASNVTHPRQAS